MFEQRIVLEDEADAPLLHALMRRHVAAAQIDLAVVRRFQPRNHAQHRRLARSRRTEDADQLAGRHFQRDAVQDGLRAEAVADAK